MDKKTPSLLGKDIHKAIYGAQGSASDDMKYCMIANVGFMSLSTEKRAQVFVSNPQILSTIGLVHFTESGLSNDDFSTVVANTIGLQQVTGQVADLQLFCEGCFSVRVAPERLADVALQFPSERLTFMSFNTREGAVHAMKTYEQKIALSDFPLARPYLDA